MNTLQTKTVGQMVTENIKTAHIFKKYNIDFCCGGGISIQKACDRSNVSFEDLARDLQNLDQPKSRATDYNNWELDFLIDHIINIHHRYVEENIPMLMQYGTKVAKVHGERHPELLKIQELFAMVATELSGHLRKEELILFPFIKKMLQAKKENTSLARPQFGKVDNPINMMEVEHEEAGEILKKIAKLSNNYTPPEGACNTYRAFFSKLDEFEQDLHHHIHLENNILFPKALQLEKTIQYSE
ncbi:iron-sulfur cluster repair di-iron protein [Zunongwangia sp. HGR-M22]|uniref:iron-sulfur cluster repair di-iron protein n=1 Tax=Zunongwangia sp. HGR-M22 TaxID=3015168 RepID=UPI0022DDC37A|nr:iron-sulfur cluster repair di-iron protein [Zunongwangia sp. HGR-M22]WBL25324.1 iron-sulfur cluster repair di-iron protein [Zunongwangia sp. HGR-M22]